MNFLRYLFLINLARAALEGRAAAVLFDLFQTVSPKLKDGPVATHGPQIRGHFLCRAANGLRGAKFRF